MQGRILTRFKRPDSLAFSGLIECFCKCGVELRFRVGRNKEDEILRYVNPALLLNHPYADCVIAGA